MTIGIPPHALPLPWGATEQEAESEEKMVEARNGTWKEVYSAEFTIRSLNMASWEIHLNPCKSPKLNQLLNGKKSSMKFN